MASAWPILFQKACQILDNINEVAPIGDQWSLGGGTALMFWINHRESYDIDVFIHDTQLLSFLNPELNDFNLGSSYRAFHTDGCRFAKFDFGELGQVDFICTLPLLSDWFEHRSILTKMIRLEKPAEIIAKKLVLRGERFQPRDIFDTAVTIRHYGSEAMLEQLASIAPRADAAYQTLSRLDKKLVNSVIDGLAMSPIHRSLAEEAMDITRDFLAKLHSRL